ncbi:MAG: erythromycin esterase family protein, partial [Micromonosporaceae bacterium]
MSGGGRTRTAPYADRRTRQVVKGRMPAGPAPAIVVRTWKGMLMNPRRRAYTWALRMLAPAVGAAALLVAAPMGNAQSSDETPPEWVARTAAALGALDPEAPLDDVGHLRRSIGDATIVALGESTHGALEQTLLKHRTVRYLVEELGYRSIAWEDDWTLGVQIDRYIRTGNGDLDALVGQMSTAWHTKEVTDVLRWLRRHNSSHRHQVRFVGVEYFTTRAWAYDAIKRYVARHAPERLDEARGHLDPIRPDTDDMGAYLRWYLNDVDNKDPYVRHAKAAYELV